MGITGDFEALRRMMRKLETVGTEAPKKIAERAAPKIEENLQEHARSRIGKIPEGITATPKVDGSVEVDAPDWVMRRAVERGQTKEWQELAADEAEQVLDEMLDKEG